MLTPTHYGIDLEIYGKKGSEICNLWICDFFLKFFCISMFMGSLPGVPQLLLILSQSIYELLSQTMILSNFTKKKDTNVERMN